MIFVIQLIAEINKKCFKCLWLYRVQYFNKFYKRKFIYIGYKNIEKSSLPVNKKSIWRLVAICYKKGVSF